jgi:hypothetical protein
MRNVFLCPRQLAGWWVVGGGCLLDATNVKLRLRFAAVLCCAVRAVDLKNALEETMVRSNRGRV